MVLLTTSKAQQQLRECLKARRLQHGLTQGGLAKRSGVSLATLRKFEQKGLISLASFLKLLMVLDLLEKLVETLSSGEEAIGSIDDILKQSSKKKRKKGWRT